VMRLLGHSVQSEGISTDSLKVHSAIAGDHPMAANALAVLSVSNSP
jgi:hypothetical protein